MTKKYRNKRTKIFYTVDYENDEGKLLYCEHEPNRGFAWWCNTQIDACLEEYKEPVVHTLYIIWYRRKLSGKITFTTSATHHTKESWEGTYPRFEFLKIERVTYTEE